MSISPKPMLYKGKPDDKLVTVDVYNNQTATKPTNLLTSIAKSVDNNVFKALTLGEKDTNALRDGITWGLRNLDKFKSKDFAKTVLTTAFPNAKAALNDLKGEVLGQIAGSMGLSANSALEAYRAVKDGNYQNALTAIAPQNQLVKLYVDGNAIVKKVEDAQNVSDFVGIANAMLDGGLGTALNLGTQAQALGSLVDTAMALQLPELADHLITLADDDVAQQLLKKAVIGAAVNGSVLSMFNYLNQVELPPILAENADLLAQCLGAYIHPDDDGATMSTMDMLKAILSKTNPDWDGSVTGKPDISVWANASSSAIELASLDPKAMMLCLSGLNYVHETVTESFSHTMPWVTLADVNYGTNTYAV